MARPFFSGSLSAKLDEKNRFVLPQSMRYGLVENGELECYLGISLGGCLAIYRKSEMEKMIAKFQARGQHLAKYQKFFTMFFSTLHETTCDKVGRVTIPPLLKEAAHIKKEIVVAGVLNKIELWPAERYEADLKEMLSGKSKDHNLMEIAAEAFALLSDDAEDAEEKDA